MILAQEDPLKLEEVLTLNVHDALFYLSYRVRKNKELEQQMKKQKR